MVLVDVVLQIKIMINIYNGFATASTASSGATGKCLESRHRQHVGKYVQQIHIRSKDEKLERIVAHQPASRGEWKHAGYWVENENNHSTESLL